MHSVIGGLLSKIFVWHALIGNAAIRCQDFDSSPTKRVIETLDYSGGVFSITAVPVELLRALEPGFEQFCDICPECYVCMLQSFELHLPPRLSSHEDFFIFYSNGGNEFTDGMRQLFERGMMKKLLWRAGVKPLRLWTDGCTAVTSLFSSSIRACYCEESPSTPKFQVLVGGIENMLALSNEEVLCDDAGCTVTIDASDKLVWYIKSTTMDKLLVEDGERRKYLDLPRLVLRITGETVTHVLNFRERDVEVKQSYYALNRTELHMLHDEIKKSLEKEDEYWFADIDQYLADKIDGKSRTCYTIGGWTPTLFTFDKYLNEDKTR